MTPTAGLLEPNTECHIEIAFTPSSAKTYAFKYTLEIEKNPEIAELNCKGKGVVPELEFIPQLMKISPNLPYNEHVYRTIQIKNNSPFTTELFSLNFDN